MHKAELIALSLVLAVETSAADPQTPPTPAPPPGTPTAETTQPVALGASDLRGLDALLPVGKTARKVVVPGINELGLLTSVTRMGKITRVDEDVFVLDNVRLTTLDPAHPDPATGKPEATVVQISKGEYIASERKLVSNRPVTITKPRLRIIGESLVYWATDGHAVLKGRSETILTGFDPPHNQPPHDEAGTEDGDTEVADPEDTDADDAADPEPAKPQPAPPTKGTTDPSSPPPP